jgi:hypothetical protein
MSTTALRDRRQILPQRVPDRKKRERGRRIETRFVTNCRREDCEKSHVVVLFTQAET